MRNRIYTFCLLSTALLLVGCAEQYSAATSHKKSHGVVPDAVMPASQQDDGVAEEIAAGGVLSLRQALRKRGLSPFSVVCHENRRPGMTSQNRNTERNAAEASHGKGLRVSCATIGRQVI